jgi:hypothetical protein
MAHQFNEKIDRMATTSLRTIWHKVETLANGVLKHIVPLVAADGSGAADHPATATELAAHVWPEAHDNDCAGTVPLFVNTDGLQEVDGHVATVSPSGRVLGIVKPSYKVLSFKTLFAGLYLALAKAGGRPQTLGTFDSGKRFFGTLAVCDPWRVPGDHSDTVVHFNLISGHGGEMSAKGATDVFRVQCANTSRAFDRSHSAVYEDAKLRIERAAIIIPHTTNAEDRIAEAVKWITDGRARAENEKQLLERLALKSITKAEVDAFIEKYVHIPDDASKQTVRIRSKNRADFLATLQDEEDLGEHALTSSGTTAYGLLQAVTRFEDWVAPSVGSKEHVGQRRAFRAFLGQRQVEKTTAQDRILAMVGA